MSGHRLGGICVGCGSEYNIQLKHMRAGSYPRCPQCHQAIMPTLAEGLKVTKDHTKEAVYGT